MNSGRNQVEESMYSYLAFSLLGCLAASIYVGWASILAWLISAFAIIAFSDALLNRAK